MKKIYRRRINLYDLSIRYFNLIENLERGRENEREKLFKK